MADFEEVIRFMADKKDVTNVLQQLQREVPAALDGLKKQAGSILRGFGVEAFGSTLKSVRDLNEAVRQQVSLYKELQRAQQNLATLSGKRPNITPQFDTRRDPTGPLSSPKIQAPLNQQIREDARKAEMIEQESFEKRLRNRLKFENKRLAELKKFEQKALAIERRRQDRIYKDNQISAERLAALERRKQERITREAERAAARRIRITQKELNAEALARRSRASRGLRIGAGLAGATGSFRLASGLFTASTAIQGLPLDDFKKGGSLIGTIGKQAAAATPAILGFGAAFAAIGTAVVAVREGLRLEKEIAKLSTLFTEAALSGVPLQQALKDTQQLAVELAVTFNIELTEAVEGFQTALSAGIDFPDLAQFSRDATELSQALGVSFSQSVDILTTLKDSYKLSFSELDRVNNILFRTIDEGKITVADLSTNLGRVSSVASTAGINIEELFGVLTFATRQGLKSSRAITSVAKFIESVVSPTEKARKKFEELGLAFGQTALEGNKLESFIQDLAAKTGGQLDVLSELFPQDRALRIAAALSQSSDAAQEFIEFVSEAGDETGDAAEAAARALDSTSVRFERFVKAIKGQTAIGGLNLLDIVLPDPEGFEDALDQAQLQTAGFFRYFNSLAPLGKVFARSISPALLVEEIASGFEGVRSAIDDIEFLNERYQETAISIAKAAAAQGRLNSSAEVLLSSGVAQSFEEALKVAQQFIDGFSLDKNIAAVQGLANVIDQELVESLDSAVNAASAFGKRLAELKDEASEIRRSEGESGLLPDEADKIKDLELEIRKLTNTADQELATIGQRASQVILENITAIREELSTAMEEDNPGGVSTAGVQSFVDRLRGLVGDTEQIQELDARIADINKALIGGSANEEIRKAADRLSTVFKEFDFGSIIQSAFTSDTFAPAKILPILDDAAAENALIGIQSKFNDIKDLQNAINELIDTGIDRGKEGVEQEKRREKILADIVKTQDKLNEKKAKDLDFSKLSAAEIEKRLASLTKLQEQAVTQAETNAAAGRFDLAERNIRFLNELDDTRKALEKGLDERVSREQKYAQEIINIREKEFEEAKKFEKERTENLRREVEKRKDIARAAQEVQRDPNAELFDRIVEGSRNDRERRGLLDERFNKLIEDARKAAAAGDTNTARSVFDEARGIGGRLTDIDFTKRRNVGVDTAREVFDVLSDLNNTIRDADISASLSVTEQLNKSAAEFSTAAELLMKALKEEGPLVSVDRSQNTYSFTIQNARASDEVVRDALEEFRRRLDQGTVENSRKQNEQIIAPPTRERVGKPAGGEFGT